jgi:BirA family transcriptional regulator, biotin operon repressor / biotin---[acetyl-CoA-carboxylase] ligase
MDRPWDLDDRRVVRDTFVVQVEHHPTLGSTNDRATQRAAQGITRLPLLVLADRQTAGRGRGSNRWWTGDGALAMSLLVEAEMVGANSSRSPLVALAIAVAVADTVAARLPRHEVGIHWPNDVLAAGRKLAGILVEVLPDRRHVIGIGLNTNNTLADAPAQLQATAATLRDLSSREHDQTDILVDLLGRLDRQFQQLRSDPAEVARRADALCLQRGRPVTLELGNRTIAGRCRGIGLDGAILLETSAGVERFHSGTLKGCGE